jgi:hypothetical protein
MNGNVRAMTKPAEVGRFLLLLCDRQSRNSVREGNVAERKSSHGIEKAWGILRSHDDGLILHGVWIKRLLMRESNISDDGRFIRTVLRLNGYYRRRAPYKKTRSFIV